MAEANPPKERPTPDEVWDDPRYTEEKTFFQKMFDRHLADKATERDTGEGGSFLDGLLGPFAPAKKK